MFKSPFGMGLQRPDAIPPSFFLPMKFLGPCWSRPWPQFFDPPRELSKQTPLGKSISGNLNVIATMSDSRLAA
jgi:hypothetical protein